MKALFRAIKVSLMGLLFMAPSQAAELSVGSAAPAFSLKDQNLEQHALSDFSGRWLVLYFYPKNDTPGCTTEACNFRDDYYQIKAMQAVAENPGHAAPAGWQPGDDLMTTEVPGDVGRY